MLITSDQIRAARALKNWSQTDLASRTGLAVPTIANIELGKQSPGRNTIEKIMDAFSIDGIEFTQNGVMKRTDSVISLSGKKDFERFYDLIYQVANTVGGPIFASNVDERMFDTLIDAEFDKFHMHRMEQLRKKIDFRVLIKEGDTYLPADKYATYKWIEAKQFANAPFYVFGDYLAILLIIEEPTILLMKNDTAAALYRSKFLVQWKGAQDPVVPKRNKKKAA